MPTRAALPPRLHRNEREALKALGVLLYATNRQLQGYLGYASPSHVRGATAGLVGRGWVASEPRWEARAMGAAERIYTPTESGWGYLATLPEGEAVAMPPRMGRVGDQHRELFQRHALAITDLIVLIARYCDATGCRVVDLRHDLALRHDPVRISQRVSVRPDLWSAIAVGGRTGAIWWEVDRGTERTQRQWDEKIARIAAGIPATLAKFGTGTLTIATVTTTAERAARLASWTRGALAAHRRYRDLFLFATAGEMADPVGFMEGRHWLTLTGATDGLIVKSAP